MTKPMLRFTIRDVLWLRVVMAMAPNRRAVNCDCFLLTSQRRLAQMLAWDHTHDWVLDRFWNNQTRVAIQFQHVSASATELAAVRRCLPQFRHIPPAALRVAISEAGQLQLGVLPSMEAREIIHAAETQGLQVVAEDASFVSYVPFDRTTGCAWLIEDEAEANAVAEAMIAAGIPVRNVES